MRSMFQPGFFGQSFAPMRLKLGQDDTSGIITSLDQPVDTTPSIPGMYTSVDQGPAAQPLPTQPDQGPYTLPDTVPITPAPGTSAPVIPAQKPAGMSDSDWGKLLAAGLSAGASSYGAYSKSQTDAIQAKADALKARNPAMAALFPSGMPFPTTLLIIGGVAVALIGGYFLLKPAPAPVAAA